MAAGCSTSRRRKRSSSPGSRPGLTTRGCWSPSSKPAPRAAAGCWRGGPNSASCWTAEPPWDTPALLRFIRLQGKQVAESVYDPVLNVIFVAWDVLVPKFAAGGMGELPGRAVSGRSLLTTASAGVRSLPAPATRPRRGGPRHDHRRTTSRTSRSCWPATRPSKRSRTPTGPTARRSISALGSSGSGGTSRPRPGSCCERSKPFEKCGRRNSERGMGKAKRRMANVRWRMTEGRWRMPDGGWPRPDGK